MGDFLTFDDVPDLFSSAVDSVGSGLSELWKTFAGDATPEAPTSPTTTGDAMTGGPDPIAQTTDAPSPGLLNSVQGNTEASLYDKIQSEVSKGADSFKQWFASLGQQDQRQVAEMAKTSAETKLKEAQGDNVLGGLLKGAAGAGLVYSAQQEKIKAARDAEERARQDTIRRGQVQPFAPNTYTPAPVSGGLVASRMAGK